MRPVFTSQQARTSGFPESVLPIISEKNIVSWFFFHQFRRAVLSRHYVETDR